MKNLLVQDVIRNYVTHTLHPHNAVRDAIRLMAQAQVGAILVVSHDHHLQGIFSERDLLNRVVLPDLSPSETPLSQVMTPFPVCIDLTDPVERALSVMDQKGCRHLPVIQSDRPNIAVAMLSIRDVYRAHSQRLHADNRVLQDNIATLQRDVALKDAYIFGAY
jgi:signal-transduction protein with cAMP-binding, CBS, and nucleotidyltransferase domain